MWMEKIRHGVLEVATDRGPRYVEPSWVERVQLLWMFRNFHVLPEQVLSRHERGLIQMMCSEERLARARNAKNGFNGHTQCIIGTVERLPLLPERKRPGRANGNGRLMSA